MSTPAAEVLLEVEGAVATLTLNDVARRNVMTPELGDALRTHVGSLKLRTDVRAVVLTGAGGAFSSGGDLKMLERLRKSSFEEARTFMLDFYARYLSVLDLPVPTVAAVEGPAIGAGLCVALACDVCIVSEESKLALNFVQLGLHPGMGATYFVPRRAGAQAAAELLLTGRRFDGKEAVRLGLALEAAPAGGVLTRARALATQMAGNAPLAMRALKQRLGPDRTALRAALEQEARFQAESYGSSDLGEGLAAAAERRAPVFQGR
ncbi:enoyl-CoA hydratase/isomerase family protein [Pyxidicoccus fallax]|uniref:Enoyl-CoA hydratase/isomerase family protein n=1 Tax=Pyxidicoccus fallax TaxID=394095 RepID=A0A848LIS3_9BACT|nr:enoyl-CoA hydratase/isomerase family protein [Pyxidicoccus fallax]NMO17598.1 enoyl-CoA hydratase/isomerase family protein [Pyxidicoccus fallax]NPC86868.1 enoyl-CoA hydratase/isomerase family protein [Pyxidicoccus fallax]